ncbi:MAG TPA: UDP-3-O-(3-hydroxymyristoyl)glucosamine N-acyltransferase, partial [Planctomycetaceae bacterium]
AEAADMAFVSGKGKFGAAAKSRAGVLFVSPAERAEIPPASDARTLVVADDPKEAFFAVLARLKPARPRIAFGQSPHAFIHPNAKVGPGTNVHPGATISSGAVVGANCDIHPGVCIGPGCKIGDHVQLHPNVVVYHDVTIGNRVTIQAGSVIGADGFGYRTRDGRHERIPHFGTVRIEDDVDVGACTTIDRAVIGETVIGQGTKIDNNVVIAHNCRLGRHNLLVSQVGFAGSVTTGDYVVCAGQVGIADHVHIGTGAVLGAKAGVHKDLAGGRTYLGAPAAPIEEATRAVMTMQKLPQLRQSLRELERQVAELRKRIDGEPERPRAAA